MQRRAANSGGERETTNRLPAQESARRRGLPVKSPLWHSCFAADPSASRLKEQPTRLRIWRGESPRTVSCSIRTVSILDTRGGNESRVARVEKP